MEPAHVCLLHCFAQFVLLVEIKVEPAWQFPPVSESFSLRFLCFLITGTAVSWHCFVPLDKLEVESANLLGTVS